MIWVHGGEGVNELIKSVLEDVFERGSKRMIRNFPAKDRHEEAMRQKVSVSEI